MGSISTGIGLISGIDTASLIESLITLQSGGKFALQDQVADLQAEQTAILDINARLLAFKSASQTFRLNSIFRSATATTSDDTILTATASTSAQPGSFKFIVKQLVTTSQKLSKGYADRNTAPVGLSTLSFELGKGGVGRNTDLANLNGGNGVDRGRITITDGSGSMATVDLTDVTTLDEVLNRINGNGVASVTATVDGDHLVVTDTSGGGAALTIADGVGDSTATDLGIVGSTVGAITGTDISYIGSDTALATLNDGNGVLVRDNVTDFVISARSLSGGSGLFNIDLGRVDAPIETTTSLSELNNGSGVTLNDEGDDPDIKFTARDGTEYEVDLTGITTVQGLIDRVDNETGSHIAITVHADGDKLTVTDTVGAPVFYKVEGAGPNGTETAEDLGLLEETGVAANTFDGDLIPNTISDAPVVTIQDVIDRINNAVDDDGVDNGGRIVASLAADGVSLLITDTTGGGNNLIIESTASNPNAAGALGIETDAVGVASDTIDGSRLLAGLGSVLVRNLNGGSGLTIAAAGSPQTLSGATLLSELFNGAGITTNGNPASFDLDVRDRLNNTYDVEVDGLTTAQELIDAFNTATGGNVTLSIEGQAFRVTDNTGGSTPLRIRDQNGAAAASELGLAFNSPVDTVLGVDSQPIYSTSSAEITITNRLGASATINIATDESLHDIINRINDAGVGVTASLNRAGNGLAITDTTGGTNALKITGLAATELGIAASVSADRIEGTNLQHQYVSAATRLDDLNYGRGIGTGTFRITDSLGASAEVNIGTDSQTVQDIIQEINSRGLAILARVNDNGDGIVIEESLDVGETAVVKLKVESTGGTVARDLNLIGEAEAVGGGFIDGSYERTVEVVDSDSLADIASKINSAGIPVSAAVINTGSGALPYHLSLTSGVTGRIGEIFVDTGGVDIGLTTLARGDDAKVFFGADNPEDAFLLRSNTNTLSDVLPGVTIDLLSTSDDAVTVVVDRDRETIASTVSAFVDGFNGVIDAIGRYDFYNQDTEERGPLLGSSLTGRVSRSLYNTAQQRAEGIGTSFQFLSEVGVGIGSDGNLEFDREKFDTAYDADPDAVENLFSAFDSSSGATEEVVAGVTVQTASQTITSRGFGDLFGDLTDRLTDSIDGTLTRATEGIENRIDLINRRIEDFDERLAAKRARLEKQFAGMELALANLQNQGNALQALNSNLSLARSLG